MDLPWNDERSNQFITNGGLITSDGPFRANVMAYEWTHYISYYVYYISKENTISDHTTFVEVIKDSNNSYKIPFAYYRGKVLDSEYRFKSHMRVLERIKEVVENIENDKR